MIRQPEIIDPTAVVDFGREVNKEKLRELPRPALVYFLSVADRYVHPGGEISRLSHNQLINRVIDSRPACDEIFYRFESTPGIFNRLHLSLWNDAFPEDDRDYCLKMRFAAAFLDPYRNLIVARSQNRRMTTVMGTGGDRLCSATACVRDQITSRTEAVMGDCGHAYFWGIKELQDAEWTSKEIGKLKKYEAGFNLKSKEHPDIWYQPWIGKEPVYTCLYCITVLGWFSSQPEVTVFKDLDGKGPKWVDIDLNKAFYEEAIQAAKKQGLKPTS